ncbi:MAG: bifunctional phosphoribosylaminoimidazolecarboxamide formyltransferase/IMP cyclohydrolase [Planctomycetota bacterium]|jgi:phosphoribosylaminoimidazolecarboxamide formyltransferase/IMP cyclohydrolase
MTSIKRALLAPYDKTGIEDFARELHERGVALLATSGTARRLRDAGLPVTEVSEHTGFPEMLGGRVKTLHPKIHGGLLGRRDLPDHVAQMQAHGIEPIDLLCLNLYPFRETIAKPDVTLADAVEQIDIGGPAMLRAAAKNHAHVVPLIDSSDFVETLTRLDNGDLTLEYRKKLAAKAYQHTCLYDAAITNYLADGDDSPFPPTLVLGAERAETLRYGENPHQQGVLYRTAGESGLASCEQLNGKALSYINLLDAAGAYMTVAEFDDPSAVVVKHANPCGAASHENIVTAFERAWEGDPVSAFGSILAFNREVSPDLAEAIAAKGFVEVVVAPGFTDAALEVLRTKPRWGKNVRLLKSELPKAEGMEVRSIPGGYLVQDRDAKATDAGDLKIVSKREPSDGELKDLVFAQRICKHVKSNAIVLVKDCMVVGVGAGQMSRVDASGMAVKKAGERAKGAVFASDAFLPFNDALEVALDAGVTAAVQPGGSKNDENCIEFVNERGVAMTFSGTRHFLH